VKISNLKITPGNISVEWEKKRIDTGLRKFGAMIGDHAEVGCNAVLNPGSVLGRDSLIYPNTNWRGVLPAKYIAKNRAEIETAERRS
jgi:acetyltransferase-like isoleucine patch superfamily enzyme